MRRASGSSTGAKASAQPRCFASTEEPSLNLLTCKLERLRLEISQPASARNRAQ